MAPPLRARLAAPAAAAGLALALLAVAPAPLPTWVGSALAWDDRVGNCNPASPEVVVVEARDDHLSFYPDSITIAPETVVRWVNVGPDLRHSSTEWYDGITEPDAEWNSGLMLPGEDYEVLFCNAGERWLYYCMVHDLATLDPMDGLVHVE